MGPLGVSGEHTKIEFVVPARGLIGARTALMTLTRGEAILSHLLERRVPTLASTHLGKLKEFAFRNARVENAHVEFDLETLGPLYRLVIGAPGESRALAIARRLDAFA